MASSSWVGPLLGGYINIDSKIAQTCLRIDPSAVTEQIPPGWTKGKPDRFGARITERYAPRMRSRWLWAGSYCRLIARQTQYLSLMVHNLKNPSTKRIFGLMVGTDSLSAIQWQAYGHTIRWELLRSLCYLVARLIWNPDADVRMEDGIAHVHQPHRYFSVQNSTRS